MTSAGFITARVAALADKAAELWAQDLPPVKIAARLGIKPKALHAMIERRRNSGDESFPRKFHATTKRVGPSAELLEKYDRMLPLLREGLSIRAVARRLGMHNGSAQRYVATFEEFGLDLPPRRPPCVKKAPVPVAVVERERKAAVSVEEAIAAGRITRLPTGFATGVSFIGGHPGSEKGISSTLTYDAVTGWNLERGRQRAGKLNTERKRTGARLADAALSRAVAR